MNSTPSAASAAAPSLLPKANTNDNQVSISANLSSSGRQNQDIPLPRLNNSVPAKSVGILTRTNSSHIGTPSSSVPPVVPPISSENEKLRTSGSHPPPPPGGVAKPKTTTPPGKKGKDDDASEPKKKKGANSQRPNLHSAAKKNTSLDDDEKGPSRYDRSLGLLTKEFMNLVKKADQGVLDLNEASKILNVQKRRIYDITNVLEGVGLIEKKSKNHVHYRGNHSSADSSKVGALKEELERLRKEEAALDDCLKDAQQTLKSLEEDPNFSKFAFVTHEDIRNLPNMQGQTLFAIKAPTGTQLVVPDPDEGMSGSKRRYQIFLNSENHTPIDVYLVSQGQQEIATDPTSQLAEPPFDPSMLDAAAASPMMTPKSPNLLRTAPNSNNVGGGAVGMTPRTPEPSDTAGLLKLTSPSPVSGLDPDYYLNNMYQSEGISDFFQEDPAAVF
eukprot:TRINITY_DN1254_c0_g1_i1.p1 TRINITY_DN1254_c0_g1~~TRINITY_DN1254_c0_g1_i1.p1  ORF type:complete len:453 (+),score=96.10 TRINITY_DN1254_c0_g1_i1:30-1361(+)